MGISLVVEFFRVSVMKQQCFERFQKCPSYFTGFQNFKFLLYLKKSFGFNNQNKNGCENLKNVDLVSLLFLKSIKMS